MIIKTQFTKKMITDECTVTLRSDGRYMCRVLLDYEIDDVSGKKVNRHYKSIYGVDKNDALAKRGEFIEEQIRLATEIRITSELLTTKLHQWVYGTNLTKTANTFDRFEATYLYQILPALNACGLSGIRLNDVTTHHIEQIMNYNLNKGYSFSTLKKMYNFLRGFFQYYMDEISTNPMTKYTFFKKEKVIETQQGLLAVQTAAKEKIQQQKAEIAQYGTSKIHVTEEERQLARLALKCQTSEKDIHVFSDIEIAKIKDGIQNGYRKTVKSRSGNDVPSALYTPKQGAFFIFMLNSGVRGGEAVSLKYSDFDFIAKTVKIQRNAVNTKARNKDGSATGKRSRKFTTPKTARSADILCLSDRAIAVIEEMKKQEPDGYDGFVVHSNYKPLAEKTLWQRFDKLLKGVGVQPCGLHSLRHTHGTKLYEATQDLKFVAQQLRHTDPSFTAKTYVHQTDKRTRELLEVVDI